MATRNPARTKALQPASYPSRPCKHPGATDGLGHHRIRVNTPEDWVPNGMGGHEVYTWATGMETPDMRPPPQQGQRRQPPPRAEVPVCSKGLAISKPISPDHHQIAHGMTGRPPDPSDDPYAHRGHGQTGMDTRRVFLSRSTQTTPHPLRPRHAPLLCDSPPNSHGFHGRRQSHHPLGGDPQT